jgi:hypothetical protein
MHGRDLHKRAVRARHGLATILTMMSMGGAMHGLAALHRLLRRRHSVAVECVGSQSDCKHCREN